MKKASIFFAVSLALLSVNQQALAQNGWTDVGTTVRLTTAGDKVGIGTTTAGAKVQVNGNTAIGYSASTTAPAKGLAVAGPVGIGTNAPATGVMLEVKGSAKATSFEGDGSKLTNLQTGQFVAATNSFVWQRPTYSTNRLGNITPQNFGYLAEFGSISLNAPSAGFVLITATAEVSKYPATEAQYFVIFGSISTSPYAAGPLTYSTHWQATDAASRVWSQNYLFPVSAGSNTFYLNFWKEDCPGCGDPTVENVSMTGLYIQNHL